MSQAALPVPVEMVHVHGSRFRSDTPDDGITFLADGTLRGQFCQVICKKPFTIGDDIPLPQLKEVFGAESFGKAYSIFRYVPDFPEKNGKGAASYDDLFGKAAPFDFDAYRI